ncbi:MAG: hypothetical protein GY799_13185 [Desulfobulbaceae bacterium]|nr:hypothetical protein [Desulfobulbaceae bacterium]
MGPLEDCFCGAATLRSPLCLRPSGARRCMPGEQLPQETLERIASFIYDNSELGDFWRALGQPERRDAAQAERHEEYYTRG